MKKIGAGLFVLIVCVLMMHISEVSALQQGNDYYTVIKEDGTVEIIEYEDSHINTISDVELIADSDIQYGVARIKGYTTYREYDGVSGKTPRSSYIHGMSANDAAFIGIVSNGTRARIKLAGVYMDVPVENVEVSEYKSNSKVSYYKGENGVFYHYYYHGSYGGTSTLSSTIVGYTPDYLKDGVKYYSYDGHYFYTDYKKMIDDYKAGVNVYNNALNKDKPYYNYYQYLSFRAKTTLTKNQINSYLSKYTGPNTSRPTSKLYNQAQALLDNEKLYGINATMMLGIAINESGWGSSNYALNYNNLFGLNAQDNGSKPFSFDTVEECLNYFSSKTISDGYLDGGDSRYRGPHLGDKQSGVNVCYASDPYWGEKAAAFCYYMNNNASADDYLYYDIAIGNKGDVKYYKNSDLSTVIYSSGASVSTTTNLNVYNIPFVIISETSKTYKIYSDTVLNASRTDLNGYNNSTYDVSRDYVYINKNDANIIYECQDKVVLELNKTQLNLEVSKSAVLTANDTVTWSSSDPSVATIKNGVVTGLKEGTATISAVTTDGRKAECIVTVVKAGASWKKIDGLWYLIDKDGVKLKGWQLSDNKWYYLGNDGAMLTGWKCIDNKWYYLNNHMITGWLNDNGKWYYLNSSMQTGWQYIDNKWYYLNNYMQTGWLDDNGKWYYLGNNGAMHTGWLSDNGKWYYLGNDGVMRTGWQDIDGKRYYLNNEMQTGWQYINEKWYYFNNSMHTGWLKINGKTYYLNESGVMLTGPRIIDKKFYRFNLNGELIS